MENKKTSELLDELSNLKDDDYGIGGKYEEITAELESREPFFSWFNKDSEESLPYTQSKVEDLEAEVKKLKRHKHDEKSGDVLVRI